MEMLLEKISTKQQFTIAMQLLDKFRKHHNDLPQKLGALAIRKASDLNLTDKVLTMLENSSLRIFPGHTTLAVILDSFLRQKLLVETVKLVTIARQKEVKFKSTELAAVFRLLLRQDIIDERILKYVRSIIKDNLDVLSYQALFKILVTLAQKKQPKAIMDVLDLIKTQEHLVQPLMDSFFLFTVVVKFLDNKPTEVLQQFTDINKQIPIALNFIGKYHIEDIGQQLIKVVLSVKDQLTPETITLLEKLNIEETEKTKISEITSEITQASPPQDIKQDTDKSSVDSENAK